MRKITSLLVALAAIAGLAYYLTTPRGRAYVDRVRELIPAGRCSCEEHGGAACGCETPASDEELAAKIAATRQRLRDELAKAAGHADTRAAGGAA